MSACLTPKCGRVLTRAESALLELQPASANRKSRLAQQRRCASLSFAAAAARHSALWLSIEISRSALHRLGAPPRRCRNGWGRAAGSLRRPSACRQEQLRALSRRGKFNLNRRGRRTIPRHKPRPAAFGTPHGSPKCAAFVALFYQIGSEDPNVRKTCGGAFHPPRGMAPGRSRPDLHSSPPARLW